MNKSTIKILVWDVPTRVFHWSMVLCFIGAWLSAESVRRRFGLQRQGGRWRDPARPVRRTRWGSPA